MIKWGISAGSHDAALAVVDDEKILFASHAERFSKIKNDSHLNSGIIREALKHGKPDIVFWYENPLLKATRRLLAGQKNIWLNPTSYCRAYGIDAPVKWGNHHESHMAAGYHTSKFKKSATLVIDAIGEWNTTTIWNQDKKVWSKNYPISLGLFYSAFTERVGLKPNCDEYILMGMAAYGNSERYYAEIKEMCESRYNFHKGVRWWKSELKEEDYFDVAAAVQRVYEIYFRNLLIITKKKTGSSNLVLMGGCALNCLANRIIPEYFNSHWIMPNPGDAGSSLGAILAKANYKNWSSMAIFPFTPYLGYNIDKKYPVNDLIELLLIDKIVGVANGKAEFGPRALGNRSLLADPRDPDIKDKVNRIKQRQEFRPFAPVIRQEDVAQYFDVGNTFQSPYMQQVVTCKNPEQFPAIVHKDGTSRVQTVEKSEHAGLYSLLTKWKEETGCPMLLNTSLNIKNKPIVNDEDDAMKFEKKYGVSVL